MTEPKYHWQYGRLSGYHWCCIGWFYLRIWLVINTGLIKYKFFKPRKRKGRLGYVTCPVHRVLHRLGLFKPERYSCPECGWDQYGSDQCAVREGHDGWIRKRLEKYFSKPEHLNVITGGKIGERIRNEQKMRSSV